MDNEMAELIQYSRDSRDESDRASAVEAATVLGAVSVVLAQMQGTGQDWCADCGDDLGEKRRAAMKSAIRCVPCQASHEVKTQGVRRV